MALGAFQGAQGDADVQKRALLAAVAQRGQAGQAQFETQQKAAQEQRAAAVQGVAKDMGLHAPPPGLAGQLGATAGAPGAAYAEEAGRQQAAFGAGIGQIGAANSAYMDQVAAAVPVVESVTERDVARIRAEVEAAKAQQAHEAEMRRLDLRAAEQDSQRAAEEHGWRGEEHAWQMGENRTAAAAAGASTAADLTPRSARAVEQATGLTLDDQMAIQSNDSYKSLAATMTAAHANGYSAAETQQLLEREAKRLAQESGVAGYGTTLKYLWSMAQDNWGAEGKWVAGTYMGAGGRGAGRGPVGPRGIARP